MSSTKTRKRYAAVLETRAALADEFPLCFAPKGASKRPLALGIHKAIAERIPDLKGVRNALRDYTRGPTYLRGMVAGAERLDIDGRPCGAVTGDEADTAAKLLATIERCVAFRRERHAEAAKAGVSA